MTSLATLEVSTEDSRPIELYEFILGSTTYRYTSSEDTITPAADAYLPEAIARTSIGQSVDQNTRNLTITVPATNAFAQLYNKVPPGRTATVRVLRYQRDESPAFDTTVLLFTGKVQTVKPMAEGTAFQIIVRTLAVALSRTMPRVSFMSMCNNFLYDQFCKANPALFNLIADASAASGATVTVPGVAASGLDFTGGYVRPVSAFDFRVVLSVAGDVLTVDMPFSDDPTGLSMQVFAGCDHLIDGDCGQVFDKIPEFNGFPYVPNKNPFQTGIDA